MDGLNKHLEKTALNAQKARQMAKKVGLMPVPKTGWKAALRKMRKGTGELLTGKELAKVKEELGVLPNNTRQKILAKVKKFVPGTEVGAALNRKGKIVHDLDAKYITEDARELLLKHQDFLKSGKIPRNATKVGKDGIKIGPMRKGEVSSILGRPRGVHTHPSRGRILDKREAKLFNKKILSWNKAIKDGEKNLEEIDDFLEKALKSGDIDFKQFNKIRDEKYSLLEKIMEQKGAVDSMRAGQKYENLTNSKLPASRLSRGKKYSAGGDYSFGVRAAKQIRKKDGDFLNGDPLDFTLDSKKRGRHPYIENILGQADNTESVNKIFPDGTLKSLYFKHASKGMYDFMEKLAKEDKDIKKVDTFISNGDREMRDRYQRSLDDILKFMKETEEEEADKDE